jgi:thymidine kinase
MIHKKEFCNMTGRLVFVSSVMNAGKTARLIQLNFDFRRIGKKTMVLKPSQDTRDNKIKSRNGLEVDCGLIRSTAELKAQDFTSADILLIDEAQFLTADEVDYLRQLSIDQPVAIYCFGLKSDFMGNLFDGSKRLLEVCDKTEELSTLCQCGAEAVMNLKYDNATGKVFKTGEIVECGGDDMYIPVCYKHWTVDNISEIGVS